MVHRAASEDVYNMRKRGGAGERRLAARHEVTHGPAGSRRRAAELRANKAGNRMGYEFRPLISVLGGNVTRSVVSRSGDGGGHVYCRVWGRRARNDGFERPRRPSAMYRFDDVTKRCKRLVV